MRGDRNKAGRVRESSFAPTARELEVLQLVADGLLNKEIAARLDRSIETVKTHVKHLIGKLEARDRTHAAVIGVRRGLIK